MWMCNRLTVGLRVRLAMLVVGQCFVGGAIADFLPSQAIASELTERANSMMASPPNESFAPSCSGFSLKASDPQKITVTQNNARKYKVKVDKTDVKVLKQNEIEEELTKLLSQESAVASLIPWQEQVRRVLNQLLLEKGYITSEFQERDTGKGSNEQTYEFSSGQLAEIQPWGVTSGNLTIVLEQRDNVLVVKDENSKVDQANRAEPSLIPAPRSQDGLRRREPQSPKAGLHVDQSITRIISLDKLRFGLNEGLTNSQSDKNESLDKKVERVSEILRDRLADEGYPLVEAKPIRKQERVATKGEKGSILMTFQLAWRQQISSSFQSYLCRRIRLGVKKPLDANKIEDQLRLLREDPAVGSIEGILKQSRIGKCPTEEFENKVRLIKDVLQGLSLNDDVDFFRNIETIKQRGILFEERKSCLEVRVTKAKRISTIVNVDNYSPPSVGAIRAGVGFRYRNAAFLGSELGVGYANSLTGGNQVISTDYRVPLNALNGALSLRVSLTRNKITQDDLDFLNIRGKSQFYELEYRQPLLRTPRQEFALSAGFAVQQGQSLFLGRPAQLEIGADQDGNTRTSVVKLGLDYLQRSPRNVFFAKLQTVIGTGLFDATSNQGSTPDGHFVSLLGQIQWLQEKRNWIFDTDHVFIVQLEGQWSPDALLRTQQFVLGGGTSVRGYRQNAASGDKGFRFSLEDRIALWDRRRANGCVANTF